MSSSETNPGGAFMPAIMERLAPQLGAEVLFEPEYQIVGCIRFPNGRQSYFWHNKFNLNSVASARIAQDKGYAHFFLTQRGFSTPRSGVFLQDAFRGRIHCGQGEDDARRLAAELGWQVYLKPLRGSGGDGILTARSEPEYEAAAEAIFAREKKVLLQEAKQGRDYRLVVLDGEVISAYERVPLTVCGDGRRSIGELLHALQEVFCKEGRDTVLRVDDPRIIAKLRRSGMNLDTVLAAGVAMPLLDVANLSCGGTTQCVTGQVHPTVAALAAEISAAMDLRFAGVDILMPDASAPLADYSVLEVNSAPGLDHYGAHGPDHEAAIDSLYLKVLQAIERGPCDRIYGANGLPK